MIGNYTGNAIDYSIICLIDYEQQEFLFNGNKSAVHFISIKPGERIIYPLALFDLKKGAHDFLLIAIRKLKDSDIPKDTEYPLLFHRANIFVESYFFPQVSYNKVYQQSSELRAFQVVVNKSKEFNDFNGLYFDLLPSAKNLKYYVHTNNPYWDRLRFAFVLFNDSMQASFESLNSDNKVLYYIMDPETQSITEIKTTPINQTRSTWVLNIENPYI